MAVTVSGGHCLSPSLPASGGMAGRRIVGVLDVSSGGGRRLVREVRHDGRTCRYRLDGTGTNQCGELWVAEEEATGYRPFCHLILERLALGVRERTFRLHRLPGAPPSRTLTRRAYRHGRAENLVALDSCLTKEGGLWVEVAIGGADGERGWLPMTTLPDVMESVAERPVGTGVPAAGVDEMRPEAVTGSRLACDQGS